MGKKDKLKQARKEYFDSIRIKDKVDKDNFETDEEEKNRQEEYDLETTHIIRENIFGYLLKNNSQICEYLTFNDTLNFVKFMIK
tara:strand:+ start:1100 stop:1351 length:252 start_codon:yes stop_codon:yes gene_type:complete